MSIENVVNNLYSVIGDSNKLITEDLKVVELGSVTRIVLCVLQPLYYLLGKDAFSHYRAANVTKRIQEYYQTNKKEIDQNDELSLKIQDVFFKLRKKSLFSLRFNDTLLSLEKIKSMPTIHELPEDLGISSEDRKFIHEKISQIFQKLSTLGGRFFIREKKKRERVNGKRIHNRRTYELFCVNEDGSTRRIMRFNSPYSLTFLRKNTERVFVMTNKVVARGGFSTVKLVFSPLNGEFYIKKPLETDDDLSGILLKALCGKKGFLTEYHTRVPEKEKPQYIQPKFDGNLYQAILTNTFSLSERVGIIRDLLSGLVALHEISIPVKNGEESAVLKASHCDIKTSNILVRKKTDGAWEAVFIDISLGQAINKGAYTEGYCPPEKIFNAKLSELVDHYNNYGQAGDMWSFGMTVLTFLLGSVVTTITNKNTGEIVETESGLFEDLFVKHLFPKGEIFHPSKNLKHNEVEVFIDRYANCINNEINTLSTDQEKQQVVTLWSAAKKMMSVNPAKRPTAAEVLEALNRIV